MKLKLANAARALTLLSLATSVAFSQTFTFETFDMPGALSTTGLGINDAGVVVGSYQVESNPNAYAGFVRLANGEFLPYTDPGCPNATLTGINNKDELAGYCSNGYAFFKTPGSRGQLLGKPGTVTYAFAVTSAGAIGGYYEADRTVGFIRAADGTITTYEVPDMVEAPGLNDSGATVGNTQKLAFLRSPTGEITYTGFPGGISSYNSSINNAGSYSGYYVGFDDEIHGMVVGAKGEALTVDPPGSFSTYCFGLNNRGQLVGTFSDSAGTHGFIATPSPAPSAGDAANRHPF